MAQSSSEEFVSHEYCKKRWQVALELCQAKIDEDDFEEVSRFSSPEELVHNLKSFQVSYKTDRVAIFLNKLEPALDHFRTFTATIALVYRAQIVQTAIVWGIISLILRLTIKSRKTLQSIVEMLAELGHSLDLFHLYHSMFQEDSRTEAALIDVFSEVVMFGAFTIHFLRNHPLQNLLENAWGDVEEKFREVTSSISLRIRHLKDRVEAMRLKAIVDQGKGLLDASRTATMIEELRLEGTQGTEKGSIRSSSVSAGADLPCRLLGFRPIPRFVGRKDVLQQIDTAFRPTDGSVRANLIALWGIAGVGKSQTAYRYAMDRIDDNIDAVFWVNSETEAQLASGFTEIAVTLALDGADPEGADQQNRFLVLKWLSQTNASWLLIFDNVESSETLSDFLPKTPTGSVLCTCRSISVAAELTDNEVELTGLSPENGSAMLIELLNRSNIDSQEPDAAMKLSAVLGGLPLAIDVMATQMRKRRMKVQQFLPFYRDNFRSLHKGSKQGKASLYYETPLARLWKLAFESVQTESEDAKHLLGVLSLLGADDVPRSILSPNEAPQADESCFAFMSHDHVLEEAAQTLVDHALVKKDLDSDSLSIHRLIQTEFREHSDSEMQSTYLDVSCKLLYRAFPKREKGLALRAHWRTCKALIAHVLSLASNYKTFAMNNSNPPRRAQMTELLASASWYLLETNSYDQCLSIIDIAIDICKSDMPELYAVLCNTAGQIHAERAHFKKAAGYFQTSIQISESLPGINAGSLADLYNNYALLMLSEYRTDEARIFLDKAILLDNQRSSEERDKISFLRNLNVSSLLEAEGNFLEAAKEAQIGRIAAVNAFETGCHFEAQGWRKEGTCLFYAGQLEKAKEYLTKSLLLFERENATQPIVATTCHTLARIAIQQQDFGDAVILLQKALLVCNFNERIKGDKGDTARIMRKLADAQSATGSSEEAKSLRHAAEGIRTALMQGGNAELMDDDRAWSQLVHVVFR